MSDKGYIYILINPSIPEMVKIGKTQRDPEERAKELSCATGVPTPFIVVYTELFDDCSSAEKFIHTYLEKNGFRVSTNREYFRVPINEAINAVIIAKNTFENKPMKKNYSTDPSNALFNDDLDLLMENGDDDFESIDEDFYEEIREPWEDVYDLAEEYLYGSEKIFKNVNEAIKLYKQAANLGCPDAYYELGSLYLFGDDVPENRSLAKDYFIKGAEKGHKECLENLASIFVGEKDARQWLYTWQRILNNYKNKVDEGNEIDGNFVYLFSRYGYKFIKEAFELGAVFHVMDWISLWMPFKNIILAYVEEQRLDHLDIMRPYYGTLVDNTFVDPLASEYQKDLRKVDLVLYVASKIVNNESKNEVMRINGGRSFISAQELLFSNNSSIINISRAVDQLKIASQQGFVDANLFLGVIYEYGIGVDQNRKLAAQYYIEGANKDDISQALALAGLYEEDGLLVNCIGVWKKVLHILYSRYNQNPDKYRNIFFSASTAFLRKVVDKNLEGSPQKTIAWLSQFKTEILTNIQEQNREFRETLGNAQTHFSHYITNENLEEEKISIMLKSHNEKPQTDQSSIGITKNKSWLNRLLGG